MTGVETGALVIDDGPGERREVLVDPDGRPRALKIVRASWAGRRALWGEVYAGRITRLDPPRRGAYVDLGLAEDAGFVQMDARGRARRGEERAVLVEGALVGVRVAREAARGKNPVVELTRGPVAADGPGLVAGEARARVPYDPQARAIADAAVDEALARMAAIPGGGRLIIEPTAALVAIDVDAGGRQAARDAARFTRALNCAAAEEMFRQLHLRGLGGLVAVDFVSMRDPAERTAFAKQLKAAAKALPRAVSFAAPNAFDVGLMSVRQLTTPVHEVLLDAEGRKTAETVAYEALRALEREGAADRGARLTLTTGVEVANWLAQAAFDWRAALTARIGARFSLGTRAELKRESYEVSAS